MSERVNASALLPADAGEANAAREGNRRRWLSWTLVWVESPRLPYSAIVAGAGLITLADMALEHYLAYHTFGNLTFTQLLRHLVLPALTVYMLIVLRVLKRTAVSGLAELRPSVQLGDEEYDRYVYGMVSSEHRVELTLLVTSLVFTVTWFVGLRKPPLIVPVMPLDSPAAAFMLFTYTMFGWILLTLARAGIQVGRGLGALANRPLVVNVFDPTNLLAFGRIALTYSLSMAGVVLILLIGYGAPTEFDEWAVLLAASLASLAALILPLVGVNAQMRAARYRALLRMHDQLAQIDRELLDSPNMDPAELKPLADRTIALVNLRKTIQESPTWPFRDTATVLRAVAVTIAPLLYFTITEIIRVYVFGGH